MRLISILFAALVSCGAAAACPPSGAARDALVARGAAKWEMADDSARQRLALDLTDCLHNPDPVLRDDMAFTALATWMRGEKLTTPTVQAIRLTLLARLTAADPLGFGRPFAALALAEVARIDRRQPFLSMPDRTDLVRAASAYLASVRDYRGFDDQAGWRHGVAHGADLMMQLALNPALELTHHQRMLDAIAVQVAPTGTHFYQYGEGERLMTPVFYLARRSTLSAAHWDAWFETLLATYQPRAPTSQITLAQRHNLKAFLLPLVAALLQDGDATQRERLLPAAARALRRLS